METEVPEKPAEKKKMSRVKKTVLWTSVALLCAVLAFVAFVGHFPFAFAVWEEPSAAYADVLRAANRDNPAFGETPITEIALLGSHDALSYEIGYGSPSNTSEDTVANNGWLRAVGNGAVARYSKAQRHDIAAQLRAGVRYIDARITYIDGTYYTSHGLVSHELEASLLQILRFLYENPGEYIVFHIVHYYAGESTWSELCAYLAQVKFQNKNLYDYVNYDPAAVSSHRELTYDIMTDNGNAAGALLMSENMDDNDYAPYFALSRVDSAWHNIADSAALEKAVDGKAAATDVGQNCLRVNQAQTTPNGNDVWSTFVGWSLLDMAARHNERMVGSPNLAMWIDKMPVYLCDYATSSHGGFNEKINAALLRHNLSVTPAGE